MSTRNRNAPTLDGEPARVTFPLEGPAIVQTLDGRRTARIDQARARAMAPAFQSPAFARPRAVRELEPAR